MTIKVDFRNETFVWWFPSLYALGQVATEDLIMVVPKSCRVCHKAEHWSNVRIESDDL